MACQIPQLVHHDFVINKISDRDREKDIYILVDALVLNENNSSLKRLEEEEMGERTAITS